MGLMLDPVLVTPPTNLVVTLPEAKLAIKVDHDDEDSEIADAITDAISEIDGAGGILHRALINQEWLEQGPCFPPDILVLALKPVSVITHIKYFDDADAIQTLSASLYNLHSRAPAAYVKLIDGESWPTTFRRDDAIEVQYIAGYGPVSSDVPGTLRRAIKLAIGHYYANRESIIVGTIASELPRGVMNLLRPFIRAHF